MIADRTPDFKSDLTSLRPDRSGCETASTVPVMYEASSDERKATAAAISDGSACRARGVAATAGAVRDSSRGGKPATAARATQLTRIPS
jgi:hypothetical protein